MKYIILEWNNLTRKFNVVSTNNKRVAERYAKSNSLNLYCLTKQNERFSQEAIDCTSLAQLQTKY